MIRPIARHGAQGVEDQIVNFAEARSQEVLPALNRQRQRKPRQRAGSKTPFSARQKKAQRHEAKDIPKKQDGCPAIRAPADQISIGHAGDPVQPARKQAMTKAAVPEYGKPQQRRQIGGG